MRFLVPKIQLPFLLLFLLDILVTLTIHRRREMAVFQRLLVLTKWRVRGIQILGSLRACRTSILMRLRFQLLSLTKLLLRLWVMTVVRVPGFRLTVSFQVLPITFTLLLRWCQRRVIMGGPRLVLMVVVVLSRGCRLMIKDCRIQC